MNLLDSNELYDKVAKEFDIDPVLVEKCVLHQFYRVRETMQHDSIKPVLLHGFGSFHVPLGTVETRIRQMIGAIRKGGVKRGEGKIVIRRLWETRRRMLTDDRINRST